MTADAFSSLSDFFSSGLWSLLQALLGMFAIVFWFALGYWVFKDARRRIEDARLVAISTVIGLIPPYLGPIVYMLFRPPEYLEDVRERELEIKAIEERLAEGALRCPVCRADVDSSFLVCPVCTTKLKQACSSCNAPLEAVWQVCPYCETPIEPAVLMPLPAVAARSRRRAD
ncbi:MAG TPA: zinc ribbon domain-containing protein [Gaiellaceae bacterium]|nr:zinc ribbon domain-containing protein [Gaiellaceae bacterium]